MSIEQALKAVDEELARRGLRVTHVLGSSDEEDQVLPLERGFELRSRKTDRNRGSLDLEGPYGADELEPGCAAALDRMTARYPQFRKALIARATMIDQGLHGKGVGTLLFEHALLDAAKDGFAFAPDTCATYGGEDVERSVSDAAWGVWRKLAARYPHEWPVLAGVPEQS